MTPHDARRAKLYALLHICRVDMQAFLHDRTPMETHPMDECVDKIMALFATKETDLFQQVMQASADYVKRFGGQLTEAGTVAKFDEECQEFKECIDELVIFNDAARQDLLEEFVDMNITAGGVFAFYGVHWEEIEQAMRKTLDKLGPNNRTTLTHAWNDETQTVERIGKVLR